MLMRTHFARVRRRLNGLVWCYMLMLGAQSAYPQDRTLVLDPEAWPRIQSAVASDPKIETRIAELLSQMTLEEKLGQMVQAEIKSASPRDVRRFHLGSVLNGGGSWPNGKVNSSHQDWLELAREYDLASIDTEGGRTGVPIIWGTDAVHGHNNVVGATLFPHNIGLGAANDEALIEEIGRATALEVAATGIDWTFAPTLAVVRDDRWGRTYEGYSEDPEIVARLGAALVRGLQGATQDERFGPDRVLATAKHFLGDGGTLNGRDQGDVFTDERTLRDRHGAGYFSSLATGVQVVMASYSTWRGYKMHGNKYFLTTVLKNRMGFDGFVVGDWNGHEQVPGCAVDSCAAAINAGVDMIMVPEEWRAFLRNSLYAARAGEIEESRINDAVARILRVKLRAGLFDGWNEQRPGLQLVGHPEHRALARRAARQSLVLLKNEDQTLPLRPDARMLVAGHGADDFEIQTGGWTISWQGRDNRREHYSGATSILEGIRETVEPAGGLVTFDPKGRSDSEFDVAIVVFGERAYAEGEGDRNHLVYQEGDSEPLRVLQRMRERGIPSVAVFLSGRPMVVNEELAASSAFVAAWLPGSEGGAIADLLFADEQGKPRFNFHGKLSFSWPRDKSQVLLNRDNDVYFPLFPQGFGLTYQTAQ